MTMFSYKCDTLRPVTETDSQKEDSLCLLGKGPKSVIGMNGKDDFKISFI